MSLPFELSTNATTEWLKSLSHLNSANAANQLNKVIKELRSLTAEADELLQILIKLTPTILFISSDIEQSLVNKNSSKAGSNPQKIEKLCIQLLRNSSLAFYSFSSNECLSDEERKLATYMAIQIAGYAQRSAAIFHHFSSSTLWQVIGELYLFANENNILLETIDHKIKDFKQFNTIETVIKRNLLFSILSPYQYTNIQVRELFSISEQYLDLLDLKKENSIDIIFAWEPENSNPPYTKSCLELLTHSTINIDTRAVVAILQSDSLITELDLDTLHSICEKLSGYELINHPKVSALEIKHLIVGFNEIAEYLEKLEKLNKIEQLSSQYLSTPLQNETIPFKKASREVSSLPNQSNSRNILLEQTKSVKIIQTRNIEFYIAETYSINYSIGDIVLLCTNNLIHEPGIIRQFRITNQSGTIHILIEKINGTATFHQTQSSEPTTNKLLVIELENSRPELVFPPNKLSAGTQIKTSTNKQFTLDKLTDCNPYFMRYSTS